MLLPFARQLAADLVGAEKLRLNLIFFLSSFKGDEGLEHREKQLCLADDNDKPLWLMSSVWNWSERTWLLIRLKVQGIRGD